MQKLRPGRQGLAVVQLQWHHQRHLHSVQREGAQVPLPPMAPLALAEACREARQTEDGSGLFAADMDDTWEGVLVG